jgi:hypothetical protein
MPEKEQKVDQWNPIRTSAIQFKSHCSLLGLSAALGVHSILTFQCPSYPDDDDDRDGHQNVSILCTPNAADSPRRLHQVHSPRKHQDL